MLYKFNRLYGYLGGRTLYEISADELKSKDKRWLPKYDFVRHKVWYIIA